MGTNNLLSEEDILELVSLKEILAGFAHEIAQPLNAIMIASQVIQLRVQRCLLSDDEKSFLTHRLGIVSSQVQRATQIVENLRGFSKRSVDTNGKVDVRAAFERVHSLMGQQFVGRGIELAYEYQEPLPPLSVSEGAIELVLVQGLSFARDAVEAIGKWHDENGISYHKSVDVRLSPYEGGSAAHVHWRTGHLPEGIGLLDPAEKVGLTVASSILGAMGGNLDTSANSLLIVIP